jgi:hypothetical protein
MITHSATLVAGGVVWGCEVQRLRAVQCKEERCIWACHYITMLIGSVPYDCNRIVLHVGALGFGGWCGAYVVALLGDKVQYTGSVVLVVAQVDAVVASFEVLMQHHSLVVGTVRGVPVALFCWLRWQLVAIGNGHECAVCLIDWNDCVIASVQQERWALECSQLAAIVEQLLKCQASSKQFSQYCCNVLVWLALVPQ